MASTHVRHHYNKTQTDFLLVLYSQKCRGDLARRLNFTSDDVQYISKIHQTRPACAHSVGSSSTKSVADNKFPVDAFAV